MLTTKSSARQIATHVHFFRPAVYVFVVLSCVSLIAISRLRVVIRLVHVYRANFLPTATSIRDYHDLFQTPPRGQKNSTGHPADVSSRCIAHFLYLTMTYGISTSSSVLSSAVISKMIFFWCSGMGL